MPLTYPGRNQTFHALRKAAAKASKSKHCIGEQETGLTAKYVAEFAIQRLGSCHGEKIGGSDPGDISERVQITTNFPIDSRDNGLVQEG